MKECLFRRFILIVVFLNIHQVGSVFIILSVTLCDSLLLFKTYDTLNKIFTISDINQFYIWVDFQYLHDQGITHRDLKVQMNKKNFATLGKLLLKFKLYVFF